jgi:hypothetical protein
MAIRGTVVTRVSDATGEGPIDESVLLQVLPRPGLPNADRASLLIGP